MFLTDRYIGVFRNTNVPKLKVMEIQAEQFLTTAVLISSIVLLFNIINLKTQSLIHLDKI